MVVLSTDISAGDLLPFRKAEASGHCMHSQRSLQGLVTRFYFQASAGDRGKPSSYIGT